MFGEKIVKVMDHALKTGCPIIGINDSGGARIQEGVVALGLYAEIFKRNTHASGVIPQISLVMGPCAGGAVYSPALTDFIVMVDQTSHMFITGPDVIKTVTGEEVTLRGPGRRARPQHQVRRRALPGRRRAGRASTTCKALLSYLPSQQPVRPAGVRRRPPTRATDADLELDTLIPDSPNQPYDMHDRHRARRSTTASSSRCTRSSRRTSSAGSAGSRAARSASSRNQPMHFAGTLDIDASEKAARFVRTCDAFNVPVLTFVDVPGFLPGTDQEWNGIIRRGAKLLYAYAEATVPLVTVITRKAYGGAYDVMGSKHLGADINLAWPTAQIAVMGAQGAVNILYRRELAAAEDPDARRAELIDGVRGPRSPTPTSPPSAATSTR